MSLIAQEHLEIKNIILTNKLRYIHMIKTEMADLCRRAHVSKFKHMAGCTLVLGKGPQ